MTPSVLLSIDYWINFVKESYMMTKYRILFQCGHGDVSPLLLIVVVVG